MKALVLGSGGVVGSHFSEALKEKFEVITLAKTLETADFRVDALDAHKLEEVIKKSKPDVVVNAIKPPLSTDEMETKRELAYAANTQLPENLASWQKNYGYTLVHISTDWVYEGKEGVTYREDSFTYPKNYYSYTKALAEEAVRHLAPKSLILRTEGVFGLDSKGTNIFLRIKKAAEEGKPVSLAKDQFSQPIYAGELARIALKLMEDGSSGIFNTVGPEYLSRSEFGSRLCKFFGFGCGINEFSIKERPLSVPSHLKVDTAKAGKHIKIKTLEEQFADLLRLSHDRI